MNSTKFLEKLLNIPKTSKIAIMGHRSADFDCIGSCIAMYLILDQLGFKSEVFVENNLDSTLKNNIGDVKLRTASNEVFDVCIMVDCPSLALIPENVLNIFTTAKTTFVIDHHISNTKYAQFNYVKSVSSACEVIFTLFRRKIQLTPQLAKNLYLGIYTDTGGFKYSNTTSKTFAMLSILTKQDFKADEVVHNCVDLVKRDSFELTKCAFNSVKFYSNGQIAVSVITKQDLDNNKVDHDTSKFMQSYLQNIEGVKIAVSITERKKNEYNISLRTSCDNINVSAIAKRFGGGGHIRASGLTLKGDYKKALNALLVECKNNLKGQNID